MDDVIRALNAEGFYPDEVIPDGKLRRFKRSQSDKQRDAWLVVYGFNGRDGQAHNSAVWGDWHEQEVHKYTSGTVTSSEDRALIKKQIDSARKKAEKEEERDREELRRFCTELFPTLGHELVPYAKSKGLSTIGEAYSSDGVLVVPVTDGKVVHGYQIIQPDGQKRFKLHTAKKGNFFPIGEPTPRIWLTEGWATGMTVHQATNEYTVVCFDAGNLEPVAANIRKMYPRSELFLAGDNDEAGHNNKLTGYFPETPGFDWNDEYQAHDLEFVRKSLSPKKQEPIRCLGFRDTNYFYTSETNRQIVSFQASGHSTNNLLNLMPLDWWGSMFPNKEGVNWTAANSWLMSTCRSRGIFSPKNIRGTGVWEDHGIRINCGDRVYPSDPLDKYTYIISDEVPSTGPEATREDVDLLLDVIRSLSWNHPNTWKVFAGWLAIAPFCGILQWRPHLWLTGGAGAGKSTILESIASPVLGPYKHYMRGATTEAGIRQTMGHNALPVLFDEFETNDRKTGEKIKSVLDLFRQASSESSSEIVKGSSSGEAVQYSPKFCALVSSIRTTLENDADVSRFTICELSQDRLPEHNYKLLEQKFLKFDHEYSVRMFSRTFSLLPTFKSNYVELWDILNRTHTSRFAQQYATLLAGYSILVNQTPEQIVKEFDFDQFKTEDKEQDQWECLNHLVNRIIQVDTGFKMQRLSIQEMIGACAHDDASLGFTWEEKNNFLLPALWRYGIKMSKDHLYIRHSHPELKKLFDGTRWEGGWARSLGRIPDSVYKSTATINGIHSAVVKIPIGKVVA